MLNIEGNHPPGLQERFAIANNRLNRNLRNMFISYLFLPTCVFFIGLVSLQRLFHLNDLITLVAGIGCYFLVSFLLASHMATRAARRINKLLSVLSDFSHELASPLANLKGGIHSLQKLLDADESSRKQVEALSISCDSLCSLHQDLRVLAMWGAPLRHSELSLFNSGLLAKDCTEQLRFKCSEKGVTLVYRELSSTVVIADKQAIARVLSNLLGNALKYCPEGAEISLVSDTTRNHVIYEVQDDGPGLQAASLNRIFERHFRAAPSDSNAASGSGLGMTIAKEIVESHGGRLTVEQVQPKGLKFVVQFPTSPVRHPFSQVFDKMT